MSSTVSLRCVIAQSFPQGHICVREVRDTLGTYFASSTRGVLPLDHTVSDNEPVEKRNKVAGFPKTCFAYLRNTLLKSSLC